MAPDDSERLTQREYRALLECARLRLWLRMIVEMASPEVAQVAARGVNTRDWPIDCAPMLECHGAHRTGGLR